MDSPGVAVSARRQPPARRLPTPGPELRPVAPVGTVACPSCGRRFVSDRYHELLNVCSGCGHHGPVRAADRIEQLADPGSADRDDHATTPRDPLLFNDGVPYPERLARAREKTGLDEAASSGRLRDGDKVVFVGFGAGITWGGAALEWTRPASR